MGDPSVGGDGTIQVLQYALDSLTLAQNQVAANIANDQTPNYTDVEVDFESSLQAAIESPNGGTAAPIRFASPDQPATNGNNVDLTAELMEADRDTLQYQAVVDALNFKFRLLKGVMGGGYS
jgi:flagellar basal-body rod protein FlgB